jgi:hypothetical protein
MVVFWLSNLSTCSTISSFSAAKARTFISSTASSPSNVREISSRVAPLVSMKKKKTVMSYVVSLATIIDGEDLG